MITISHHAKVGERRSPPPSHGGFTGLLLFCQLLAGFTGCQRLQSAALAQEWKPTDVRLIDAIDSTDPNAELITLYTRGFPEEIQVRLDFLELAAQNKFDIILDIDYLPGGIAQNSGEIAWDAQLTLPASGGATGLRANCDTTIGDTNTGGACHWGIRHRLEKAAMRVQRDPSLDTVQVSPGHRHGQPHHITAAVRV